jgi:hypothetical protein
MALLDGFEYVKRDGAYIKVRGSAFANWDDNAFTPADAKKLAARIMELANQSSRVTVELSRDEAEVIMWLVYRCGGTPDNSPRKYTLAVLKKLAALGVTKPEYKTQSYVSIYFDEFGG